MSIYQAIGMAWVIFTSSIATVGFFYLAYTGLKNFIPKQQLKQTHPEEQYES